MYIERTKIRGYFGMGIYAAKHEPNVGVLWRTINNLGGNFIFTIGKRYKTFKSDTGRAFRHIPLWEFEKFEDLKKSIPKECDLVAVEITPSARPLTSFIHPDRAIYLLGGEDIGIPSHILGQCRHIIQIPSLTKESMNVSISGGLVAFDRQVKRGVLQ